MNLGFEVTAATPKRLRAAEDAPTAQAMRGDRKITQAPSTDQKKARREQGRKTAASSGSSPQAFAENVMAEYERLCAEGSLDTEAGIRDWWKNKRTAFEPLKNSGLPGAPQAPCLNCGGHGVEPGNPMAACGQCAGSGSQINQAAQGLTSPEANCRSCNGSGTGFHGEVCSRCGGTGSGKANRINPNFGIGEDSHAPFKPGVPARTVLPNSYSRTAAMNDVGDCRLCDGPLEPKSRDGETVKAECKDCGTEHSLQNSDWGKKVSVRNLEFYAACTERERNALKALAFYNEATDEPCAKCGNAEWGWREGYGHGANNSDRFTMVHCRACGSRHNVFEKKDKDRYSRTSSLNQVVALAGATWVLSTDTNPYLAQSGMSAIARRAQSVLDTKEFS